MASGVVRALMMRTAVTRLPLQPLGVSHLLRPTTPTLAPTLLRPTTTLSMRPFLRATAPVQASKVRYTMHYLFWFRRRRYRDRMKRGSVPQSRSPEILPSPSCTGYHHVPDRLYSSTSSM